MKYKDVNTLYCETVYNCFIENFKSKIKDYPRYKYQYIIRNLSSNQITTLQFIETHTELNWDWYEITNNPNITLDFIEKFIDKSWNWGVSLSSNKIINNNFVIKYKDKNWNWYLLTTNTSIKITEDFIEMFIDKSWNWAFLSDHPNISCNFIDKYNHIKYWHWNRISNNSTLTSKFLIKYLCKSWNWYYIINESSIKLNDIIDITYSNEYNKVAEVYKNQIFTLISCHKDLTWDIVLKYPTIDWNWNFLSSNKNINWNIISNNLDKPWVWSSVSNNPNISIDIILNNIDKDWNWGLIFSKTSSISCKNKDTWIEKKRYEIIAANIIHRFYRNVSCNPEYKFAKRRLMKLFNE